MIIVPKKLLKNDLSLRIFACSLIVSMIDHYSAMFSQMSKHLINICVIIPNKSIELKHQVKHLEINFVWF